MGNETENEDEVRGKRVLEGEGEGEREGGGEGNKEQGCEVRHADRRLSSPLLTAIIC